MPALKNHAVLEVWRNVRAFMRFEAGVVRGEIPPGGRESRTAGVSPENLIWIFGTARTGSTWLMRMMAEMPRTRTWNEPKVGKLFGEFYDEALPGERKARNFIFGEPLREGWVSCVRRFVLDSARNRHPDMLRSHLLVVKEPNGSIGAPILSEALPESRVVLLVRDPRDVISSALDALREGSWLHARRSRGGRGDETLADTDPDEAVRLRAEKYMRNVGASRRAFAAHRGPKALVRYEDLRSNTLETLRGVYAELKLPFEDDRLAAAVEKHRFEAIPEEERGAGKKFRKATPGGWREDLTAGQVALIEEITAPLLEEFYPTT